MSSEEPRKARAHPGIQHTIVVFQLDSLNIGDRLPASTLRLGRG
jgi:hypothetical protein